MNLGRKARNQTAPAWTRQVLKQKALDGGIRVTSWHRSRVMTKNRQKGRLFEESVYVGVGEKKRVEAQISIKERITFKLTEGNREKEKLKEDKNI